MRMAGQDTPSPGPNGTGEVSKQDLRLDVWAALEHVIDPELRYNIVDLGLVRGVDAHGGDVTVRLTLTSPGCPYGPYLIHQVRTAAGETPGVKKADVELVWKPPWDADQMSEEARLDLGFDV